MSPDSALMGWLTLDKTLLPDSPQENGCNRTKRAGAGDPSEASSGSFQGGPEPLASLQGLGGDRRVNAGDALCCLTTPPHLGLIQFGKAVFTLEI